MMRTQFRGVTQYGIVNRHDANDFHINGQPNKIDTEVLYMANAAFNPFDLENAVHKEYVRYLEWKPTGPTSFTTDAFNTPVHVVAPTVWDDYGVFSERVINMVTGQLVPRAGRGYGTGGYTLTLNADGTATFTGLPSARCKILYSTKPQFTLAGPVTMYTQTWTLDTDDASVVGGSFNANPDVTLTDTLRTKHLLEFEPLSGNFQFAVPQEGDATWTYTARDFFGYANDLKVFKGHTTFISWDELQNSAANWKYESSAANITITEMDVEWSITAPLYRDIHVWHVGWEALVKWDMSYNATANLMTVTMTASLATPYPYASDWDAAVMYYATGCGQYEWVEVGRDAASVDSAGAALVAAAFKNKQVEIGIAGVDMVDANIANRIPNVMAPFTSGYSLANYKDGLLRAALADDWCTYWPVASSNIIGVGGPLANLFSYYANDFTSAFYGIPEFAAGSAYSGVITGIPCWNRAWDVNNNLYNVYSSSSSVGYAVIATVIDPNATQLFSIFGHWGRDTYYATQWFYGDEARDIIPGIHQLQEAPAGVTSIIIKIDYANEKHPTFSIVEVLGTKSEMHWIHEYINGWNDTRQVEHKGGIHDDA
jgi:hypothetical protein